MEVEERLDGEEIFMGIYEVGNAHLIKDEEGLEELYDHIVKNYGEDLDEAYIKIKAKYLLDD